MKSDIIAEIQFYHEKDGGRKNSLPQNFFGCPMIIKDKKYDCRILLNDIGKINPGDKVIVPIKFLDSETVLNVLEKDDKFNLWEMSIIAEGKVIKKCISV